MQNDHRASNSLNILLHTSGHFFPMGVKEYVSVPWDKHVKYWGFASAHMGPLKLLEVQDRRTFCCIKVDRLCEPFSESYRTILWHNDFLQITSFTSNSSEGYWHHSACEWAGELRQQLSVQEVTSSSLFSACSAYTVLPPGSLAHISYWWFRG